MAAHLRAQGRRSYGFPPSGGRPQICLYRSGDGCSCSVGCLIPDRLYDPALEGRGVDNLKEYTDSASEEVARHLGLLGGDARAAARRLKLLLALQRVHDASINWGPGGLRAAGFCGEEMLRLAAGASGLRYAAP